MIKPKQLIFLLLLFIVVGIAAVSTNVIINGSTPIASNPDDFSVYFSDVLVNGTQDLSLVRSETSLVFNGEFSAVGDKKEITYDVTNASKNYDADIDISCTQSTDYLTISNSFDTSTNLAATSTRTGVLTITLSKSYTGADLTQDISCTISASAVERTSQGDGVVSAPLNPYYIGREIKLGTEKFNIISETSDSVTLFAQHNISDMMYKQTLSQVHTVICWGCSAVVDQGDLDLQSCDGDAKDLLNKYVEDLKTSFEDESIVGDLISLKELKLLGCSIPDSYESIDEMNCKNSSFKSWLVNGQTWWTRTTDSSYEGYIWVVTDNGSFYNENEYYYSYGLRPTITIKKNTIEQLESYQQYNIGEEILIDSEKFNVISDNGKTISLLAQYNIDSSTFKQSVTQMWGVFSNYNNWETSEPEVDIQEYDGYTKELLNKYVDYLQTEGQTSVVGDIVSLNILSNLGCTVDYESGEEVTCSNSPYKSWLVNNQWWWTRSKSVYDHDYIWIMTDVGNLGTYPYYNFQCGVRPIITIPKEYLE